MSSAHRVSFGSQVQLEGSHSETGYVNHVFPKAGLYSLMCLSVSGFETSLAISLEVSLYFYLLKSDTEEGFVNESPFFFEGKNVALLKSV